MLSGWRASTIEADLHAERDDVFRDIQGIKTRLRLHVEYARPEDFVPPLAGSGDRHLFIDRVGSVDFYHYDPTSNSSRRSCAGFGRISWTPGIS